GAGGSLRRAVLHVLRRGRPRQATRTAGSRAALRADRGGAPSPPAVDRDSPRTTDQRVLALARAVPRRASPRPRRPHPALVDRARLHTGGGAGRARTTPPAARTTADDRVMGRPRPSPARAQRLQGPAGARSQGARGGVEPGSLSAGGFRATACSRAPIPLHRSIR